MKQSNYKDNYIGRKVLGCFGLDNGAMFEVVSEPYEWGRYDRKAIECKCIESTGGTELGHSINILLDELQEEKYYRFYE